MKIIESSIEIIYPGTQKEWIKEAQFIELAARNCYKTENKITPTSWKKFVKMIKDKNHGAMLEFGNFICKIITDRGCSHELVRHRMASYAQESTRWCNYSKEKFNEELIFIKPGILCYPGSAAENCWIDLMKSAEHSYLHILEQPGCKTDQARSVLPNSLKTEIIMKCNWRELLYIIALRTAPDAHFEIKKIFNMIKDECAKYMPEIFS